jgi:sugar/nucleoside kinase (ribokinase family)
MLQTPKATSYIGCIGDDEFGKQMEKLASEGGVDVSCCTLQAFFSMPIFCDNFIFCH